MKSAYMLCAFFMFILVACKQNTQETAAATQQLAYAQGFTIQEHTSYKELTVWNPWAKGKVYARYYLVTSDTVTTPTDGTRVHIPLRNVALSSATHIAFVNQISQLSSVRGVCSPQLVYDEHIRHAYNTGEIADLGDALQLNLEATLHLNPEAFFAVGYNSTDHTISQLQKTNIPVIHTIEWMENSLLARAEWIKFIAAFYEQDSLANCLFNQVETNYRHLSQLTQSLPHKPTIMSGGNFRGTWYMPSGKNYMGQLFQDAGAHYHYAHNQQSGSLPLTIEEVMAHFANADVWVGSSANSLDELARMDNKHTLFKAFREKKIYNFNKRITPQGANDFWELGLTRPDLLLADLISILHPDLLPRHTGVFTTQLQ
ncbi:MAG: ABC transporter substrate-binding protein [Paludibacteraceae bacterium]|nr:ABC transporter substrate-binding protein [Paludibacteraceae bacterium]